MIGRTFWQGLRTIIPFAITIAIVYWVCAAVEHVFAGIILWFLPAKYYYPGMGFVVGIILVFFVGIIINAWIASWAKEQFEKLIHRIPLIKTLYRSSTDLMSFFDRPKAQGSRVVTLEYGGTRMVGIVTREQFEDCPPGIGSDGELVVYLPLAYQIGGAMVVVPKETVTPVDMSVEFAMRFIITCGMQGEAK